MSQAMGKAEDTKTLQQIRKPVCPPSSSIWMVVSTNITSVQPIWIGLYKTDPVLNP